MSRLLNSILIILIYPLVLLSCTTFIVSEETNNDNHLGATEQAPSHQASAALMDKWVIVLADPRPSRMRGWNARNKYQGSRSYDKDPRLDRLAEDVLADKKIKLITQWPINSINVHCLIVLIPKENQQSVLTQLKSDKRIKWVQPYNSFDALSLSASSKKKADKSPVKTNDPYARLQSSFAQLNLADLTNEMSGAGIDVAVIDSGVEYDHPDIAHAIVENIDFVGAERHSVPAESHGTGVVGVIAAKRNNGEGIAGISPKANIHAYRSCWQTKTRQTKCDSLTLARALDHVAKKKPKILNLSLSGPKDRLLDSIIDVIIDNGTIVLAAYDHKRASTKRFPSPNGGILIVKDNIGQKKLAKNEVIAPGSEVITTQPGKTYAFMSGSSMATAHMSSIVALMTEISPNIRLNEITNLLKQNSYQSDNRYHIDLCRVFIALKHDLACQLAGVNTR